MESNELKLHNKTLGRVRSSPYGRETLSLPIGKLSISLRKSYYRNLIVPP